jgi:hypothetical protein
VLFLTGTTKKIYSKITEMKSSLFLMLLICTFIICCESENIEEKYFWQPADTAGVDTTDPTIPHPQGEIAWFPLNGNLNDSTGNNIPLLFVGDSVTYVSGLNPIYGKGIYLDGSNYLIVNLGYYDTLAIVFWIKGAGELGSTGHPILFDYGLNAISAQLDGSTGATAVSVHKSDSTASSVDVIADLNSFSRYSFLYFEAGSDLTRVYYKGYYLDGTERIYEADLNFPGIIDPLSEILYIGRSSSRNEFIGSLFQGAVDEIHIFSHPLTDQEIEAFAFTQTE